MPHAYLAAIVLAGTVGQGLALVRSLRMLTLGLLTPIYFTRAGRQMARTYHSRRSGSVAPTPRRLPRRTVS